MTNAPTNRRRISKKTVLILLAALLLLVQIRGLFFPSRYVGFYRPHGYKPNLIEICISSRWNILLAPSAALSLDKNGGTPPYLQQSIALKNYPAFNILLFLGADPEFPESMRGEQPIHTAAKYHDIDSIRRLIESGSDVNAADNFGMSPLHALVNSEAGASYIHQLYFEMGMKTYEGYELSCSALKFLIQSGADIHNPDKLGRTPLFLAAMKNKKYYVETLLGAGANINTVDNSGKTALDWSLENEPDTGSHFSILEIDDSFDEFPGRKRSQEVLEEHSFTHFIEWLREQGALTGEEIRAQAVAEKASITAP